MDYQLYDFQEYPTISLKSSLPRNNTMKPIKHLLRINVPDEHITCQTYRHCLAIMADECVITS